MTSCITGEDRTFAVLAVVRPSVMVVGLGPLLAQLSLSVFRHVDDGMNQEAIWLRRHLLSLRLSSEVRSASSNARAEIRRGRKE